jgi:hypothetical protein
LFKNDNDRNRIRMYPALVNCTTIDLFNEWPQEALLEVGEKYLSNVNLEGNEQVNKHLNRNNFKFNSKLLYT